MEFEVLLRSAQAGERAAMEDLLKLYEPMLIHNAIVNGSFDEDLYQELCITFLRCIRLFRAE